ncbi:MAG: glycogen synthase [Anaerovoracaceae bacterium]|jgi:starch synthase
MTTKKAPEGKKKSTGSTAASKTRKTAAKKTAARKTTATRKTTTARKTTATRKKAAEKPAALAAAEKEKLSAPAGANAEKIAAPRGAAEAGIEIQVSDISVPTVKSEEKQKLNILFVTPEVVPFASSGGLGEVSGSLPKALNASREANIDCRVIMPLYGSISEENRRRMKFLGTRTVPLTWRQQYMGLFKLVQDGVTYYFVDNEYYFKREGLYGYYDDCERFAYFSKAIFYAIELMEDFVPNIIHANDWQTALVPIYQNSVFRRRFTKTVFTVHNIEYQGHYGREVLKEVIGLPQSENYVVDFGDDINLMKGGIESANIFSTVSPTYAEELKYPGNAFGLDKIVRRNSHKLRGILNGIDTEAYDPSSDKYIAANYSAADLSGKAACKKALQRMTGLPVKDVPVLTLISRLVPAKGIDLIVQTLEGILENKDVQFVMLGTGYENYEDYFNWLQSHHSDQACCMIKFDMETSHQIYAGGDILLMPSRSEPCGLAQMIGCRYGNIPLVRETGGLADSIKDCTTGDGNGFTFANYSPGDFYNATCNAIDKFNDKDSWNALMKHDMELDFSWKTSAEEYIKMYESMF